MNAKVAAKAPKIAKSPTKKIVIAPPPTDPNALLMQAISRDGGALVIPTGNKEFKSEHYGPKLLLTNKPLSPLFVTKDSVSGDDLLIWYLGKPYGTDTSLCCYTGSFNHVGGFEFLPLSTAASRVPGLLSRISRYHDIVGADPEIFAVGDDGKMLPAFAWLPGPEAALKVTRPDGTFRGTAYWDGYQAEFAPKEAMCLDVFRGEINDILKAMRNRLPTGAKLTLTNVFTLAPEQLRGDPDVFVNFGCKPSFNAYGEDPVVGAVDPRTVPIRSAGGHLHFTLPPKYRTNEHAAHVVRVLDAVLGVASVSMFQKWDVPERRRFYGRAGEFRTPKYGVEYRVLSNAWLCHPVAYNLTYELARRAVGIAVDHNNSASLFEWDASEQEIRDCINNCDVALSHTILTRNKEMFISLWPADDKFGETVFNAILKGMHAALKLDKAFEPVDLVQPAIGLTTTSLASAVHRPEFK